MRTILVAGCGSIGRRHIENLLHLGAHRVLAQDPEAERREYVRNTFHIDCLADFEDALSQGVDTVFICNPTSLHVAAASAALRSNCDVFIEKPLSHSAQGLTELLELSKNCGRLVFVACNFRFEKGMQQVHALLRENRIGRVFSAMAEFGHYLPDWRPWQDYRKSYSASKHLGGGVLLDAYHEFDFLDWLLGPVDQVFCIERKTGLLEIDTEDMAIVTLSFAQGALGQVHLDYLRKPYTRRFELIGELGTLQWDFGKQAMRHYDAVQDSWRSYESDGKTNANQMYVEELRHFLACLEGQEKPICTLEDAIRVQSTLFAAMDSAHSGKAFRIGEMNYSRGPAAG
jgi:predicted dehydrogenase